MSNTTRQHLQDSVPTRLRWPTTPLVAWRDIHESNTLHAGRNSPNSIEGLCGVDLWGPLGWRAADMPGVGNVIPWETAASHHPPHVGEAGNWDICQECLTESMTKKETP